jgi:hypothetical protein
MLEKLTPEMRAEIEKGIELLPEDQKEFLRQTRVECDSMPSTTPEEKLQKKRFVVARAMDYCELFGARSEYVAGRFWKDLIRRSILSQVPAASSPPEQLPHGREYPRAAPPPTSEDAWQAGQPVLPCDRRKGDATDLMRPDH